MASKALDRCSCCFLRACNRSRTTSDFETLRSRDSASISAMSGSGRRTVRVFIHAVYYTDASFAIRRIRRMLASSVEIVIHPNSRTFRMILLVPNFMANEQFIRPLPETELVGAFRSVEGKKKSSSSSLPPPGSSQISILPDRPSGNCDFKRPELITIPLLVPKNTPFQSTSQRTSFVGKGLKGHNPAIRMAHRTATHIRRKFRFTTVVITFAPVKTGVRAIEGCRRSEIGYDRTR